MKNKPFAARLGFAWAGIKSTFGSEHSFRFQTACAALVFLFLLATQPAPIWWAIVTVCVGMVLAFELLNTALESIVDRLHPEIHPAIKKAKDCAAGAVLVMSLASLGVFAALILSLWL